MKTIPEESGYKETSDYEDEIPLANRSGKGGNGKGGKGKGGKGRPPSRNKNIEPPVRKSGRNASREASLNASPKHPADTQ